MSISFGNGWRASCAGVETFVLVHLRKRGVKVSRRALKTISVGSSCLRRSGGKTVPTGVPARVDRLLSKVPVTVGATAVSGAGWGPDGVTGAWGGRGARQRTGGGS